VVIGALAAVAALVSSSSANAGGFTSVSQGAGSTPLPSYQPFENTDPATPETVSFILRARNSDELQAQVLAGMPRGFLTTSQFASQYGQSPLVIAAIRAYLALNGIQSHVMADNLVIQTTGTAGQYNKAFQIVQQDYKVPALPAKFGHGGHGSFVAHGSAKNPKVPTSVSSVILSILGLSNYPSQESDTIGQAEPTVRSTSSSLPNSALLPGDFKTRYGLDPVAHAGGTGHGRTIGIVTLAALEPGAVTDFWSQVAGLSGAQASASRIQTINVDGGPRPQDTGSDETDLDTEQSGTIAPDANIRVYQAANTDAGFADAFYQAASDNVADSVSASWGESESIIRWAVDNSIEDQNYAATFDQAFLELDAQGQSAFMSSGDSGAYPGSRDLGSTDIGAGNPDGSPFVTSAGGTTLPGPFAVNVGTPTGTTQVTFNFPAERTWGWDYLWPLATSVKKVDPIVYAESHVVGGGGGYSVLEKMPSYQRGVRGTDNYSAVPYLTPTAPEQVGPTLILPTDWAVNFTPRTITGHGNGGRATPDLSTDADPETGYLYVSGTGDAEGVGQAGGTSFVAPQLNGTAAAIDSLLGRRVGFWNPAIYKFATQHNSPFSPIDAQGTSNDNIYYSGTPGNVYNVGSGLGVPDFTKLAADFASNR
jgi:subtilase family serine protease